MKLKIGRRRFLQGLGLGAATLALAPRDLVAQASPHHRFVSLYFEGGWDILYSADPRHPSERRGDWTIQLPNNYLDGGRDEFDDLLEITLGSHTTRIHPSLRHLLPHTDVLTLFRGVNMNTVAHENGRAYVNTYRPSNGANAVGDSLGTLMAAASPWHGQIVPNVAIGVESHNLTQNSALTGARIADATQAGSVFAPIGATFDEGLSSMIDRVRGELGAQSCIAADYGGGAPVEETDMAWDTIRRASEDFITFDAATQARYGFTSGAGDDPGLIAATLGHFLTSGMAKSVSAKIAVGFDTHRNDNLAEVPMRLAQAGRAISALLDDLRNDDPNLEHTTVLLHSEFGRTPNLNGNGGRDHWLANNFLVFGGGLKRGVVGGTQLETLERRMVDPITGAPSDAEDALSIEPEHIGATLVRAAYGEDGWNRHELSRLFRFAPLTHWIAEG